MTRTIKWKQVDSSNVDAVAYDEATQTMCVKFLGGGLYSYEAVGIGIFTSLENADSVGGFLNRVIKPYFSYNKWVSEADLLEHINTPIKHRT